jgi:acetyl esterase
LYRGAGTAAGEVLPCLLFLHGGGWVIGDLDSHDGVCRRLANDAACCVVAVDYRRAPEHRFPAGVEDAAASLAWTTAHAAELRIDPARIAVAATAPRGTRRRLAHEPRWNLPRTVFQRLIYPAVDPTMTSEPWRARDRGRAAHGAHHALLSSSSTRPTATADRTGAPRRCAGRRRRAAGVVVTAHDPLCDEKVAPTRTG